MNVVLTTLNAKYTHSSLALRYLREYCQVLPCSFIIKEFSINQQLLAILGEIYEEKPDVIGLSCSIWNIEMTLELSSLIKKVMPDVVLVCGGPEVSYDAQALLEKCSAIDYVVEGEGEETFYQLLDCLLRNEQFPALPALSYRLPDGKFVIGAPAVVADLNTLPFPYQDPEMINLQDKIIYYESSRGCPFSCQYCLSSATRGVRFLAVERVLADLKFFIRHQVRQVKFVDRTFNTRKEHYLAIWRFLTQVNCTTNFHFEISVDLLDAESLAVLAKMPQGRIQLEIGVQSTNPVTLQRIQRINHWEKITTNVNYLMALKTMHLHLDLIVGLPEEDYASFARSFNDVYNLQPDMLQIGFLKMLKGAGITKNAASDGYVFMEQAPYQVLANSWLGYKDVYQLTIFTEIFEQYYNSGRFRNTLRYLVDQLAGDAFNLFDRLTDYWRKYSWQRLAHSNKSLYEKLMSFCKSEFSDKIADVEQLLKLDALFSDKGQVTPEFLPWSKAEYYEQTSEFWRSERVQKYLPEFKFTNWRNLQKHYHIEVFDFLVSEWLQSGKLISGREAVLFEYHTRDIKIKCISYNDLLGEGKV